MIVIGEINVKEEILPFHVPGSRFYATATGKADGTGAHLTMCRQGNTPDEAIQSVMLEMRSKGVEFRYAGRKEDSVNPLPLGSIVSEAQPEQTTGELTQWQVQCIRDVLQERWNITAIGEDIRAVALAIREVLGS